MLSEHGNRQPSLDRLALTVCDLRVPSDAPTALRNFKADLVSLDLAHEQAETGVLLHARLDTCLDVQFKPLRVWPIISDDSILAIEATNNPPDVFGLIRSQ
ncbi:MAG: hypothetical protein P4L64_18020 [Caulobacteraceae bacterium]|nr:hypothetical protein [Caulobacteraceae bacterium]